MIRPTAHAPPVFTIGPANPTFAGGTPPRGAGGRIAMDMIKVPGPDHPITISGASGRLRAVFNGRVIAESADALMLKEAGYKPVSYFPRADVTMECFSRTDRDTYCPYKGHAAYFTISAGGRVAENGAWTYETPHPAMAAIKDHVAFYPHDVEIVEAGDGS
jgi:uncharacterized protein (DUF427 family)